MTPATRTLNYRPGQPTGTEEKRFLKLLSEQPNGCIFHMGALNRSGAETGYVQFRYNSRNGYAHRYAWERVHGPIPSGMTIDHICEQKRCVNIDHLQLVDGPTNSRLYASRRTTCKNGLHALPPGGGRCAPCQSAQRKRGERRRLRVENGLPDRRRRVPADVRAAFIERIRSGELTVSQAAASMGINAEPLRKAVWRAVRDDVLERDHHRCVRCGASGVALQVHHRLPRRGGGSFRGAVNYALANLVSLCGLGNASGCHGHVEQHPSESLTTGYRLRDVADAETTPLLAGGMRVYLLNDGSVLSA